MQIARREANRRNLSTEDCRKLKGNTASAAQSDKVICELATKLVAGERVWDEGGSTAVRRAFATTRERQLTLDRCKELHGDVPANTSTKSEHQTTSPSEASRPVAISWTNKFGMMAGSIEFTDKSKSGRIYFDLPDGSGRCNGRFQYASRTEGVWSVACPSAVSASGDFKVSKTGGIGSGYDTDGNKVEFSLGAINRGS